MKDGKPPPQGGTKADARAAREARLAAALRANLRRRKAAAGPPPPAESEKPRRP